MPRDLSGNMTLPTGNPVVTGTSISSSVHNTTTADLAAEIQDSLSRSGKGGMLAPFLNSDGSETTPGITFTSETNTGWYRSAAGVVRLSILGAWKFIFQAAGLIIKGALGLMDPGGTNKTVTLAPPSGLAADYTLTMPAALPASTLPVTVTSVGVLAPSTSLSMTAATSNATCVTATGNGTGAGVFGTGGGTGSGATYETAAGVVGDGGSGGGIGVVGNGTVAFTGVVGVGGPTNGRGVGGQGTGSGVGVYGVSTSGNGGQFTGNATKAALNLVPQAAPTSAAEGDIYYDSTSKKLLVRTNAGWETITSA